MSLFVSHIYFWKNLWGVDQAIMYPMQQTGGVVHWSLGSFNHSVGIDNTVDSATFKAIIWPSYTCGEN